MLQLGSHILSDTMYDNLSENNSEDRSDTNLINDDFTEEHIYDTINKLFENINKSCDSIIQSDNTFIELSLKPETINKGQLET